MRDLVLLAALAGVGPLILRAPQIGILAWIWVTLLNPQREVYGFLHGFELNFYIAILTVVAWLLSKERKVVPFNPVTGLLLAFAVWASVTTYFALDPNYSVPLWERTLKSIFLALAVVTLSNSRIRIQSVLWLIAISLGYYGVKGGGFVLLTAGRHHVYGPPHSMIADNNALGLALVMLMPLLNYLRVTTRPKLAVFGITCTMFLTILAIIGTYSRGALLALGASAATYAIRSRSGIIPLLLGGVVLVSLPSIVPNGWFARMATITRYSHDASFEGRVAAWRTSFNIAKERPIVGGGFSAIDVSRIVREFRSPGSLQAGKAAHSIYFEVLGDHGFVGLIIYMLLLASAWYNTSLVLRTTRDRAELDWANRLARTLQVCLIGYLVGGAALSMAYYDGFLILLALTAALAIVVNTPAEESKLIPDGPNWKRLAEQHPAGAGIRAVAQMVSGFVADRFLRRGKSDTGHLTLALAAPRTGSCLNGHSNA